eukprot:CAMPEP_0119535692 /NCGR_PEP_ID=MMETSP1344-20130328/48703_1 /TAXON_ID=236787 /ORGANISM="Florenciella parvula, Strain CCMP2471" /LENGTH=43 /DNA_ID= /DNA_START= /DNA_END= /DNA_ORIENTATION=
MAVAVGIEAVATTSTPVAARTHAGPPTHRGCGSPSPSSVAGPG